MAGKPRTRVAKWWGLVVIIILVAGGSAYYFHHQSRITTSSHLTHSTSSATARSEEISSSTSEKDHLTTNLTPPELAAAVLVYGGHQFATSLYPANLTGALDHQQLIVAKESQAAPLAHSSQTTLYRLAPGEIDAILAYTVEANQTINFYQLGDSRQYQYLGTVSLPKLVAYLNHHDGVKTVRQLGAVTRIN